MAWTIEYADTAKGQLRKLDKQTARRIVDFMDERIAGLENPRNSGKACQPLHRRINKCAGHWGAAFATVR